MDKVKKVVTTKTKNTAKTKEKKVENQNKPDKTNKKKCGNSKKRKLFEEDSSDSNPDDPDQIYISEDNNYFNAPLSPLIPEGPEEVEYFKPTDNNVKPGTYILINVLGGYRKTVNYKYVCSVLSVLPQDEEDFEDNGNKFRVIGLRINMLQHSKLKNRMCLSLIFSK